MFKFEKIRSTTSRAVKSAALLLTILALILSGRPAAFAQDGGATIHIVQRGESLFTIAQRYGTTVDAIAQANAITDVTRISIGQRLLIPNTSPVASAPTAEGGDEGEGAPPPPAAVVPGVPTDYLIRPGDSLLNVALRYGTTEQAIAKQNKILKSSLIYVGMKLTLQQGATQLPMIKTGWLYTVQPDDNLYRISARSGVSIPQLVKVNRLARTSVVFPGQRIIIPAGEDGPPLADVPSPFERINMVPDLAEQGRTVMLYMTTLTPATLSGTFMGKTLLVYSDQTHKNHTILYGIHSFTVPGIYPLELIAKDDQGHEVHLNRYVDVIDGQYSSEEIPLPPDQADLLDPKVTQPELDVIMNVVSKYTEQRSFDGPMGLPSAFPVTSQFGTRRSYNSGPYDQFHTGTDFAAPPGSPIYAPAGGVVVMTDTMHVRGLATIIDHGRGVFTGYWHQSEFKVHVGETVKAGQLIGLTGSTGRATGPHLHWELFVSGVQVDPLQWVRQTFS
jgi:murein DD-endopeptidase MepM/ murein hydrolase activator NlpD